MKSLLAPLLTFLLLSTFYTSQTMATVFTATASGNWSDAATWGGTSPGLAIDSTDEIVIPNGITVTLNQDVKINGAITLIGGVLNIADQHLSIAGDYVTDSGGALDVTVHSSLSLIGSEKSSPVEFVNASDTLRKLHVNLGNEFNTYQLILKSDLHVLDSMIFSRGYINIHNQDIGIYGDMHLKDTCIFESNSQSNFWLKSNGKITGEFQFQEADTFHVELTGQDSIILAWTGRVYGHLILNQGRLILENRYFVLEEGATAMGGSSSSYVQTNGTHDLRVKMNAGDSAFYPIGTATGYNPASLKLNPSSSDGFYGIRVIDNVYSDGLTGSNLSNTAQVVDQTWIANTYGATANIDVNLSTYWEAQDEVNQFNRDSCFISRYDNGWDSQVYDSAHTAPNGMFSVLRKNVTSLSPFAVFGEGGGPSSSLFIAQSSGKWSSGSTWQGGVSPGDSIAKSIQILIPDNITVDLDTHVVLDGGSSLEIALLGKLNTSSNKSLTLNQCNLIGTGNININTINLNSNETFSFEGSSNVNHFNSNGVEVKLKGNLTIQDTLNVVSGSIAELPGGGLNLYDQACFILDNASCDANLVDPNVSLIYRGHSQVANELSNGHIDHLIIDLDSPSNELTLTHYLTIGDTLEAQSGMLDFNDMQLSLEGDLVMGTNGLLSATDDAALFLEYKDSYTSGLKFEGNMDTIGYIHVDIGAGHEVKLSSNVLSDTGIVITSGILDISGQSLTLNDYVYISNDGMISCDNQTSLNFEEVAFNGKLNIDSLNNTIGNLSIDLVFVDSILLGNNLIVEDTLTLKKGQITIKDKDIRFTTNAVITGSSDSSFVKTLGKGRLYRELSPGDSAFYPIGTDRGFKPNSLKLNSGSNSGSYGVRVNNNVYAKGLTGADLSNSSELVDQTWDVETDGVSGNIDVNLSVFWKAQDEVNQFDRDSCYISHYQNGQWDTSFFDSATFAANGMYTTSRDSISILSPFAVFGQIVSPNFIIAQSSGKWSSGSTWQGGISPSDSITKGTTVVIPTGISVELDQEVQMAGDSSTLEIFGELFNSGKRITITEGSLTGTGIVDINTLLLQSSANFAFEGDLTLNNLYCNSTTIQLATTAYVKDTVSCVDATFSIKAGNQLLLNDGIAFIVNSSSISNHSISINNNGSMNLIYRGDEKVATGELDIGTINTLNVDLNNPTYRIILTEDVTVHDTLKLHNGRIAIEDNNLLLLANATVQGGGPDSYVQTSGSGSLGINLAAGKSSAYHVGTAEGYAKAWLELNSGSSDGNYMVNVQNDVWAQGSNGTDISASESVVDHTWDITTDAPGSVDVNVALTWEGAAEVNSFDNQNCYIAHYTGGSWDATATASATANANGTFTITRDNVTSLSPFAVFDENTSVGIEDQVEVANHIDLYPNPAENTLHISSNLEEPTMIRIYSVDGRLVQQATLQQGDNQLNISHMEEGTYYLHLTEADAGITFIKQ